MIILSNVYDELLRKTRWEYYDQRVDCSVFTEDEGCRSFIKSYLGNAGKTKTRIFEYIDELSQSRTKHILSCFLLGIFVYNENELIKKSINNFFLKKIPTSRNADCEKRFQYLWMLVCLFHDFGYAIEENARLITNKKISSYFNRMPRKNKGVPKLYSKKLLKKYDEYKLCRFNCHDHGVIGGIELFSDLCDLREIKKQENPDGYYWEKDLEDDFGVAAWAISCHNIFYVEASNKYVRCYREFGLDKLIYQYTARRINMERHPFFYLLCMVDSIEPIKTCNDVNVLNEISIGISSDHLIINTEAIRCQCKKEMCHEKTSSLNDWLTDVVESTDSLAIYLKSSESN